MTTIPKEFTHQGIKWKVVQRLGKGSFGEAHLIKTDTTYDINGRAVAARATTAVCKIIHLEALNDDEKKEAENEVKLLSRLNHPGIVEYYGSFQQSGMLFILMEYADAGDLEKLIDKQKGKLLDESTVGSLFAQVAHAVLYLHERRVLHRDLKAQNVFLKKGSKEGQLIVKLGDFGISTVLRNTLALAKTVCGTPYYFSPELCLSKPYNNKSDVWSLGCILYELCTLKHAFDAKNMKALAQRILKGSYEPINGRQYSSGCARVIEHMLQQRVPKRACIQEVVRSEFVQRHVQVLVSNIPEVGGALAKKHLPPASSGGNGGGGGGIRGGPPSKGKYKDQLQAMGEIRKRAEFTTYDEQQVHVEKAKKVVQDSHSRQQERIKQHDDRDAQLELLKRQMAEVDEKMRSRRNREKERKFNPRPIPPPPPTDFNQGFGAEGYHGGGGGGEPNPALHNATPAQLAQLYKNRVNMEAPWNQGKKVPIGFTQESWDAHQKLMAEIQAPTPGLGGGGAGGQIALNGAAPAQSVNFNPTPDHLRAKVQPDRKYGGEREISRMIDPDDVLRPNPDQTLKIERDPRVAMQLWEREKQKMREAEKGKGGGLPPLSGGAGVGRRDSSPQIPVHHQPLNSNSGLSQTEIEWQEFQAQRNAARQQQQQRQQPVLGGGGGAKSPAPGMINPDDRPLPKPNKTVVMSNQPGGVQVFQPTTVKQPKEEQGDYSTTAAGGWQGGHEPSTPQGGGAPPQQQYPSPMHPKSSQQVVVTATSAGPGYTEYFEEGEEGINNANYLSDDEEVYYGEEEDPYGVMVQSLQTPSGVPEPPELFEEPPLPGNEVTRLTNMVKFTLDGRTLHLKNVDQDDPLALRVEALRLFLKENLGGEVSYNLLRDVLVEIQGPNMSDQEADEALAGLQGRYGPKAKFVDLMMQLMICEDMLEEMDQQ